MDVFTVVQTCTQKMTDALNNFVEDINKLIAASRLVAAGIIAIAVLRGIGLALIFQSIERFVDGAIGARGVGVVTDELTAAWWVTLIYILATYCSMAAIKRLSGLSLSIAQRIVNLIQPISLLIVAWSMLSGSLSLVVILALVRQCVSNKIPVAVISIAMAIVSLSSVHDVLIFTATRTMTVGAMLAVGGAGLFLGLWLSARPYINKI